MNTNAAFYEGNRTVRTGAAPITLPGPDEVRVKVAFCGICGTDLHIYHGAMDQRVRLPQIIGHEMSGTIEAIGARVSGWQEGDRVTVRPIIHCGACAACLAGHSHICMQLKFLGIDSPGAMQGQWNVPAHTLHLLPRTLSLKRGALIEPLSVACHDVKRGNVKAGDYVVVLGGGPIGILIALVAKLQGATVLISEVNPYRLQAARAFGIDAVSPLDTNLAKEVDVATSGAGASVVFEVSGAAASVESMTKVVRPHGTLVVVAIHSQPVMIDLFQFFWRELSLQGARLYRAEDFEKAIELAGSDRLPLDELVSNVIPLTKLRDGLEEMHQGGKVMKILIDCS